MTRVLVIAPQWIGDAVMSEPLLRALAERGEQLTVAALPWVAPVYRAMPQVGEVIELPFAHGRLDWSARRRLGRRLEGPLRRGLRAAQLAQGGADPVLRAHPASASATRAKGATCC